MAKHKSLISASIVAALVVFFVSPLDDILFWSFLSFTFLQFQLGLMESVLIGCVVGLTVFLVIELASRWGD